MPLEFTIETIDNLDEDVKALYRQGADGKYYLSDGVKSEIGNLKSALEKERAFRASLEKERRKLQADLERFRDIEPEHYWETIRKLDDLEAKTLGAQGKFDPESEQIQKYLEKKTERIRSDFNSQVEALKGKLGQIEQERDSLRDNLHRMMMTTMIDRAALEAGIRKDALELVRLAASNVYRVEGEGELIPRDQDGQIIYGADATSPMSPDEWVQSVLRRRYPYIFESSAGGGSNNRGPTVAMTKNPREMSATEKSKYIAEHGLEAWQELVNQSVKK